MSEDTRQESTRFWEQLLPLLEEGRVIPIVGQELLLVESKGDLVPFYQLLAKQLAARFDIRLEEPSESLTLNDVACRLLANHGSLEDVYPAVKHLVFSLTPTKLPEPLVKLAEINWFKLFVSTTFDDFLRQAVDQVRFSGTKLTHSLVYALNSAFDDLPDSLSDLDRPVVYQLLGRASALQETYAVTDEDLLEFVYNLQMHDRRPKRLFEALMANHLLLIGSGFSPWLTRFFIRTVKHRDRLWQVRGRAGFVADRAVAQDSTLLHFLRHYSQRTLIYPIGDVGGGAAQFVDDLWRLWKERRGSVPAPDTCSQTLEAEPMSRHAVFLSYASEDRQIVQRIKEQLDDARIDAWFDRSDLKAGDLWAEKIKANIDASSVFIPVISRSVQKKGRREFRIEWERALDVRKGRPREADGTPASFIIPIVVDATTMQVPGVREYFGGVQGVELSGGELTADFCDRLRTLFRKAQQVESDT
jgi:hypothetical protein